MPPSLVPDLLTPAEHTEAVQMVRRPPEAEGIVIGKLDRLARALTDKPGRGLN
ncbi:MAG: hypothetical protein ACRDSP_22960 [Pseudonocardiaceae bacterium]